MSDKQSLPDFILQAIPSEYAYQKKICPMALKNGELIIGHDADIDDAIISDLEFLTGKIIVPSRITQAALNRHLNVLYGEKPKAAVQGPPDMGEFRILEKKADVSVNGEVRKEINEVSIITLVNKIITNAIDTHASDIHIEAYEGVFRVRYRRDGVLQEVMHPPVGKKRAIVSRIKIMADLDIAEKRRPQDGRIRVKRDERIIDIRVSTLPTDFGEKVVLRILDKDRLNLDLDKLGFETAELDLFRKIVSFPYGMVLVTGPTGSGKTTTLYATLNFLNSPDVNILTIEDPVEYNLNGINQSQVKSDIGFTFANALRSFLRQDPDIIMVGEIRDQETAEIAIRSALTGHLVLSTLHTNNAPDTITRLIDMDQEPFLISSSVRLVVAQRLLRMICPHCKIKIRKPDRVKRLVQDYHADISGITFYKGEGCGKCNNTGYLGRTAIFEIFQMTDAVREAVNRRATALQLKEMAVSQGMRTLQQSAICKLKQGVTTVDEVLRETEF